MRITYLGNFAHEWCTENLIARTLGRMGHEVIRIQENEAYWEEVVKEANKNDLFLWGLTYNFFKSDAKKMIANIKVPKAGFHLDVFIGIDREPMVKKHPYFKMDYFFSTDGDPETLKKFKEYGVNAYYIPAAMSKEECYIAPKIKAYENDIIFVGSTKYHKEYPYRGLLIDWLESVYDTRFQVIPNKKIKLAQGHELNKLYASTKIVIGDSFNRDGKQSFYWSNRIPETTGHGGFLIHPWVEGLGQYYTDNIDLVMYERADFEQLKELIDYYLYHDEERETIRRNGMLKTKANHTFDNVIAEMFKIMEVK